MDISHGFDDHHEKHQDDIKKITYRHLISVNGFASSAMILFLSLQQQEHEEA